MINPRFYKSGIQRIQHMLKILRRKKPKKVSKAPKKKIKVAKPSKPKKIVSKVPKKPKKPSKPSRLKKPAVKKPPKPKPKPKKPAPKTKPAPKPKTPPKPEPVPPEKTPESRVEKIVGKIKNLEIQGSNDIAEAGVRCLEIMAKESSATKKNDFISELGKTAEMVKGARPTEPCLQNSVKIILDKLEKYELRKMENVRKYALSACRIQLDLLKTVVERIAKIGVGQIQDDDVVLTHCHSEHVVAILKEARDKRKKFSVIVTETRPLRQGLITAKELLEANIDVTFVVDSSVASLMKKVTKVLIGCDAILADGSIVSKIGTYTIALIADKFQTPVFVAGETLKFDPKTVEGMPEPIEQRKPEEIIDPAELRRAKILNPAFDITPAELITALITEKGIMRPELIREAV